MEAAQGIGQARFNYGLYLANGSGVPRNVTEAAHYYKMAAEQIQAEAQFNYGSNFSANFSFPSLPRCSTF